MNYSPQASGAAAEVALYVTWCVSSVDLLFSTVDIKTRIAIGCRTELFDVDQSDAAFHGRAEKNNEQRYRCVAEQSAQPSSQAAVVVHLFDYLACKSNLFMQVSGIYL